MLLLATSSKANELDYFENLNVILSRFDGSRNTPQRSEKLRRATEIFKNNEEVVFCTPRYSRVTRKDMSINLKGDVHAACVRGGMVYVCETWASNAEQQSKLEFGVFVCR